MANHLRCRQIKAYNDNNISFIIFYSNYKLRSHTVKHVLDTFEWERGWKKMYQEIFSQYKNISKMQDKMREIACPLVIKKTSPEDDSQSIECRSCALYKTQCFQSGITEVEEQYVAMVQRGLEISLQEPRHAKFMSSLTSEKRLHGIISGPMIMRTSLFSGYDSLYNIETAFICHNTGKELKMGDAINCESSHIQNESASSPDWHTESTWKIAPYTDKSLVEKNEPAGKNYRKYKYDKHSKTDWKKWVDEYED